VWTTGFCQSIVNVRAEPGWGNGRALFSIYGMYGAEDWGPHPVRAEPRVAASLSQKGGPRRGSAPEKQQLRRIARPWDPTGSAVGLRGRPSQSGTTRRAPSLRCHEPFPLLSTIQEAARTAVLQLDTAPSASRRSSEMAEEVLADAQLIGVLMTAEEEAAQVLKAKHSRGHNQAER
jgi:hypothetical protein